MGGAGKRKLLCGMIYREHQYLGQDDDESLKMENQIKRWQLCCDNWVKASDRNDCIILGDINLDYLKWEDNENKHSKLIDCVKSEIIPLGFKQYIKGATRFWPGTADSLLDHCWANCPKRVIEASNIPGGASDHNLIVVKMRLKDKITREITIKKRLMKNFDEALYKRRVKDISWDELLREQNVDIAVNIFTENLRQILDEMAPIKIMQIRNNYAGWLTSDTKDCMLSRDSAHKLAIRSQNPSDWMKYRKLRN